MIVIPNSFYGNLVPAIFRHRLHRFGAEVEMAGGEVEIVHIPNSGRLRELLYSGNRVGLHFEGHPGRKTDYTLVKARTPAGWCYIDSRLPNRILVKHWSELPPLKGFTGASPEVTFGNSRFDLALRGEGLPGKVAFLEAKCVTLIAGKTGLFPDAPTARGRKHLEELIAVAGEGGQAFIFFFLQHPGGGELKANRKTDPGFADLMKKAKEEGVKFYAYRVVLNGEELELELVPVWFS